MLIEATTTTITATDVSISTTSATSGTGTRSTTTDSTTATSKFQRSPTTSLPTTTTAPPTTQSTIVSGELVLTSASSVAIQENRESIEAAVRNSLAVALQTTPDQVNILALEQDDDPGRRLSGHSRLRVSFEVVLLEEEEEDEEDTTNPISSTESVLDALQSIQDDPKQFVKELQTNLVDSNVAPLVVGAAMSKPEVQKRTVQFFTGPWSECAENEKPACCIIEKPLMRFREVWCADVYLPSERIEVALCRRLKHPEREEPCPKSCSWHLSDWSPCVANQSSSCEAGWGLQHRTVECLSIDSKAHGTEHSPEPAKQQKCLLPPGDCNGHENVALMNSKSSSVQSNAEDGREQIVRPQREGLDVTEEVGSAGMLNSTREDTAIVPEDSDSSVVVIVIALVCIVVVAAAVCAFAHRLIRKKRLNRHQDHLDLYRSPSLDADVPESRVAASVPDLERVGSGLAVAQRNDASERILTNDTGFPEPSVSSEVKAACLELGFSDIEATEAARQTSSIEAAVDWLAITQGSQEFEL